MSPFALISCLLLAAASVQVIQFESGLTRLSKKRVRRQETEQSSTTEATATETPITLENQDEWSYNQPEPKEFDKLKLNKNLRLFFKRQKISVYPSTGRKLLSISFFLPPSHLSPQYKKYKLGLKTAFKKIINSSLVTRLKTEKDSRAWYIEQGTQDIIKRMDFIRRYLHSFPSSQVNFDTLSYRNMKCNFQAVLPTELWVKKLYKLLSSTAKLDYDTSGPDIDKFIASLSFADEFSRQIRDQLWQMLQDIEMLETFRVPPSLLAKIKHSECKIDLKTLQIQSCEKHSRGISCLGLSFESETGIQAYRLSPIVYPKFHVEDEPNQVAVFKGEVWDQTLDLTHCPRIDAFSYECAFITQVPNSCFASAELTTASVNDIHRNCRIKTSTTDEVIIEHFQDSTLIHGNTDNIDLEIPGLATWSHFPVVLPPSVEFSITQNEQKLTFTSSAINELPQVDTTSFSESEMLRLSDGSTSTPSWRELLKFFQGIIPTEITSLTIFALFILTGILYLLDCGSLAKKFVENFPRTMPEAMSMLGQGLCWLCRLPNRSANSARTMWHTLQDINHILQGRRTP